MTDEQLNRLAALLDAYDVSERERAEFGGPGGGALGRLIRAMYGRMRGAPCTDGEAIAELTQRYEIDADERCLRLAQLFVALAAEDVARAAAAAPLPARTSLPTDADDLLLDLAHAYRLAPTEGLRRLIERTRGACSAGAAPGTRPDRPRRS